MTQRTSAPTQCGFCSYGNADSHRFCPGAIRNKGSIIKCGCPCDTSQTPRCLDCKHTGEIDPDTWTCADIDACGGRRQVRLEANPVIQEITQIKENVMNALSRSAKNTASGAPTGSGGEAKAPRAPKVGKCLVTGEPTKGGLFKPGMDARYISLRVQEALAGSPVEDVKDRMKVDGVSDTLVAKFEKALRLAREKAEQAEKAKAEKAKAKEDAEPAEPTEHHEGSLSLSGSGAVTA